MMTTVSVSKEIAASPEQLWGIISDPAQLANWFHQVTSATISSEGEEEVGSTRHLIFYEGSKREDDDVRLTAWEPNQRLAWLHEKIVYDGREADYVKDMNTSIELERQGAGTRVTITTTYEVSRLFNRLLDTVLMRGSTRKEYENSLDRLEELATGQPPQ